MQGLSGLPARLSGLTATVLYGGPKIQHNRLQLFSPFALKQLLFKGTFFFLNTALLKVKITSKPENIIMERPSFDLTN